MFSNNWLGGPKIRGSFLKECFTVISGDAGFWGLG